MRERLGFDQVESVNVGAAPTPPEVIKFFHAIGIPLAELWGMSETCGAGTREPAGQDQDRHGRPALARRGDQAGRRRRGDGARPRDHAGLPQPARQDRGDDRPTTAGSPTGDIGEFDEDGYLKIVDRKKELIINAAGKNMSPANIEAKVKTASPLIGQAVAIGDAKPYNVALITLDPDVAPGLHRAERQATAVRGRGPDAGSTPPTRSWPGSSRSRSSSCSTRTGSRAATS